MCGAAVGSKRFKVRPSFVPNQNIACATRMMLDDGPTSENLLLLAHSGGTGGKAPDEEKVLMMLKKQLEKKPEPLEEKGMATSITVETPTNANNNNSLIDSRGCAKPEKKVRRLLLLCLISELISFNSTWELTASLEVLVFLAEWRDPCGGVLKRGKRYVYSLSGMVE